MENKVLRKLQLVELEILKAFCSFCENHSLTYYLIGGALLGAVRYNAFIPWDDDVDVAMPRPDYEKFQKEWTDNSLYFLQSSKTEIKFSRCILKLRKKNTRVNEECFINAGILDGIYIDIFPIDYLDNNNINQIRKTQRRIRRLMSLRSIKSGTSEKKYMFIKKVLKTFLVIIPYSFFDRRIDFLCTKDNHKEHKYSIIFVHNYDCDHQLHSIDVFGNGTLWQFENIMVRCPDKVDIFLTTVFGSDYLEEPEENKKKEPHSFCEVVFND